MARSPAPDSTTPSECSSRGKYYISMGLISAAVLLFEIGVTRVLSVVVWYHFAFLAVSLAMLGLGLPGVWFSLYKPGPHTLRRALLGAGIALPLGTLLIVVSREIGAPLWGVPSLRTLLSGGMLYNLVALTVPLLCLGSAVCLLLMEARGRDVGRMYAADLLGGAAAAAAIVPLMHVLPTPAIIAGTGVLPLLAAALLEPARALVPGIAAAAVLGFCAQGDILRVRVSKSYAEPGNILIERWTPTARLVVFPNVFYRQNPEHGFGWGMGSNYRPLPIEQLWIEQDGSAGTPITRLDRTPADLPHLFFDVTSLGYQLRRPRTVCVIGGGGGRDILTALAAGAQRVDAVELNPEMVTIVSEDFGDFSGDIYHRRGVNAIVSEGRSFLARNRSRYDVLQVSLIDSWAATSAGAFALSENYLYTTEAIQLYLDHLTPEGVLSISRWIGGNHQLESARLALMLTDALRQRGAREPNQHLYIARAWDIATFLTSPRPISAPARTRLDEVCAERGFVRYWPLGPAAPKSSVSIVLTQGPASYEAAGFNIEPSTDDRPFFFQTASLFGAVDRSYLEKLSPNEHSVSVLRILLGVVSVLAVGLFLLPFLLRRRMEGTAGLGRGSGYFFAIGLAFMLVEMPWVQQFVLYLGHPSYATTVVLSVLLLGAGAGSTLAGKLDLRTVSRWFVLLPLGVGAIHAALGPLHSLTLGYSFPARVAVSASLLAPAGCLMGFAFPSGMTAFVERGRPWFWAVNGMASVLSSVGSLAVAMVLGLSNAVWCGVVLYVAAGLLLWLEMRQRPVEVP